MALLDSIKILHADNFVFYLKSHNFHWNIEGPNFKQYHNFLEKIYTAAWKDVDTIAEQIRALDAYAPGSMSRFKELSTIQETITIPTPLEMLQIIYDDLQKVILDTMTAYTDANKENEIGLSNFLQDKYNADKKTSWMLRSTLIRK